MSGKAISVLFASDHAYLPQRVGGTKASTHDLCLSLGERGHRAAVLAMLGRRDLVGLYHRVARRVLPRERPAADRVLGYPVYRAREVDAEAIRIAAARTDPSVIVVQAERPSPLIAGAMATGRPVAVYLRDVELHKIDAPLPVSPQVRYIANSAFTAARYRDAHGIAADVVPPVIRAERFRAADAGRRFVTFVNPVPLKGSEIAFALAEARRDLPFLFVAGWPVDEATDRERQARARAAGNITWQPTVQDMRKVYGVTRILLAPSQWEEAWCRVVSEAQINAIPVLASNRGGLPESVGPGGLLVDHDAPIDAWLAALGTLADDAQAHARYAAAARAHAERADFTPRALTDRIEAILVAHAHGHAPEPAHG